MRSLDDAVPANNSIDLVVVGFTGELRALKLQARSIRLYADPGLFGRILYICNDNNFRAFKKYIKTDVYPELGIFADCVEIIHYSALAGTEIKKTGWRSQQALKLLAARVVTASQYMILDSKNHFIRPVTVGRFVSKDGKLKVCTQIINPLFQKHYDAACEYFAVKDEDKVTNMLPTTTPFLMPVQVVRQLLDDVEQREGIRFFDFFTTNIMFNEFYFYDAYLRAHKLFCTTYVVCTKYAVALFSGFAQEPERVHAMIKILDNPEVCCTGVHRHIFEVGLPENMAAIAAMWRKFALVEAEADIRYFQKFISPKKRKRFGLF